MRLARAGVRIGIATSSCRIAFPVRESLVGIHAKPPVQSFEKLVTLIPLNRIDADADELTERAAEATLSGFQVLWHPRLLARSHALPVWLPATQAPLGGPGTLVLVPEASLRVVRNGWQDESVAAGTTVVQGGQSRAQMLERLDQQVPGLHATTSASSSAAEPPDGEPLPVEVEDFYALGLAKLWWDAVLAHMGRTTPLAEDAFQQVTLAAATAFANGNSAAAREALKQAFAYLDSARNNVYPVDLHLLDLCLVDPATGWDRLDDQLRWNLPINLIMTARVGGSVAEQWPATAERIRAGCEAGTIELVGGEFDESVGPLDSIDSQLWQLSLGRTEYERLFGRSPVVYGRRRFGLSHFLPQLLSKAGIFQSLHFAFDDGDYPSQSETRFRWEGTDSTTIEALARIPFRADIAEEWLVFPRDLAKSIGADQVATIVLAHWPMPDCPWYADLLRIARLSTCLGRFTTISQYFQSGYSSGISVRNTADQYSTASLRQAHRRDEPGPISRHARRRRQRAALDAVFAMRAISGSLTQEPTTPRDDLECQVERDDAGATTAVADALELESREIAERIGVSVSGDEPGQLAINPLSFVRQAVVLLPQSEANASNFEATQVPRQFQVVEVPAFGFAWTSHRPSSANGASDVSARDLVLQNRRIRVALDPKTGGIRSIQAKGRDPVLLGQQLVVHGMLAEKSADDTAPKSDAATCKTRMVAEFVQIERAGPCVADAVAEGYLIAEPVPQGATSERVVRFRQRFRLAADRPVLEVRTEFLEVSPSVFHPRVDPWQQNIAARFAWGTSEAAIVRGFGTTAEATERVRFEAPEFVEIHARGTRTAIVTAGLPFYQRCGTRMLDLLLLTAGERTREFDYWLGVDLANPFQTALELASPLVMVPTESAPLAGHAGWFFHVNLSSVWVTSARPLSDGRRGLRLRVVEIAGEPAHARLATWCSVRRAVMTDFHGAQLIALDCDSDGVRLDLMPHEIAQVDIEFADPLRGDAVVSTSGDIGGNSYMD